MRTTVCIKKSIVKEYSPIFQKRIVEHLFFENQKVGLISVYTGLVSLSFAQEFGFYLFALGSTPRHEFALSLLVSPKALFPQP